MQEEIKAARTATSTAELSMLVESYSGHVRQAALKRCAELARSDLLELAIGRLNDWVPVVRDQARATVKAILPNAQAQDIIGPLDAVERLHRARRIDHGQWIADYEAMVVRHVPAQALLAAMRDWRSKVSPICFRLLKENALVPLPELIEPALAQKARLDLAREAVDLIAQLPEADREAYYLRALDSHFGPSRGAAIRALLWQSDSPGRTELALAQLAASQPSIRAAVHHFLVQQGVDMRARYCAMILEHPDAQLKMNLLSLAACGNRDDLELVRRFVDSPQPSIRIAAMHGWLKLDPPSKDLIAATAMRDPSPRARRFGLTLVRRHGAYVPVAQLHSAFEATGDYRLLYVAQVAGIWAWLEAMTPLVMTASVPDQERAEFVAELSQYFYSNTARYQRPTASQIALLRAPAFAQGLRALLQDHTQLHTKLAKEVAELT